MYQYQSKDKKEMEHVPVIHRTGAGPLSAVYHRNDQQTPQAPSPYDVHSVNRQYMNTNMPYPSPPPPPPPPPLKPPIRVFNHGPYPTSTTTIDTIRNTNGMYHFSPMTGNHSNYQNPIQYTQGPDPTVSNQQMRSSTIQSPFSPTPPAINEPAVIFRTSLPSSTQNCHPPSSDSRFIVIDEGNASPRLIKPVSQRFPKTSQVNVFAGKHHGDENSTGLGILCTPLAVPSEDFQNDDSIESVPVIYNSDNPRGEVTRLLRCAHCSAYWNPNVYIEERHVDRVIFRCNFCQHRNLITEKDMENLNNIDITDLPLKYGTVEYDVGGDYKTAQNENGQQLPSAVHLFALDANDGPLLKTYLSVIASVAKNMEQSWAAQMTHQQKFQKIDETLAFVPRIGILLYVRDHIVIPHWKKKRPSKEEDYIYVNRHGPASGNIFHSSMGGWKIDVSLMTDVSDDPFCPLPLNVWTYPVCQTKSSSEDLHISQLYEILDAVPILLERIIPDYNINIRRQNFIYDPNEPVSWNCGCAALAVMAHCLEHDIHYSGGCGTLLTNSRPNHGLGALDDREGHDASIYFDATSEKSLLTPRQSLLHHSTRWKQGAKDDPAAIKYYELGRNCLEHSVTLNIIYTSPLGHENGSGMTGRYYIDISTLGELCRHTCGVFRWIKAQDADIIDPNGLERDTSYATQLKFEILRTTITPIGFDSVFKVRVSSGLQVKRFFPDQNLPGASSDSSGRILSTVMPDTCLAVEIDHRIGGVPYDLDKNGHRLKDVDPTVYFQTALLYTNSFGRRRLRVSTLALQTASKMIQIYDSINFDVVAAFMTRQAVSDFVSNGEDGILVNVRQRISDRCFGILANYISCCGVQVAAMNALTIPERMKLLPLVCMGLKKSRMFRQSISTNASRTCRPSPSADERAYHILYSSNVSPSMAVLNLYPSLYNVTTLCANAGEEVTFKPPSRLFSCGSEEDIKFHMASIAPYIQLPPTIRSSISAINDEGIYLLDDGFTFSLLIGKDVSLDVRAEILSIESNCYDQDIQNMERRIQVSNSDYGIRMKNICSQLRKCYQTNLVPVCSRHVYSPMNVILSRGGPGFRVTIDDTLESEFLKLLIEDTSETDVSYTDFLLDLERRISNAVR